MPLAKSSISENPPPAILLVEDDPALRALLRFSLEGEGSAVLEAETRTGAMAALRRDQAIAVVILDLGLPPHPHETGEGIGVIREAQAMLHPAKIIVLTGQDQESAALEAIREGAFDFLGKPAGSAEILTAVRRALLFSRKERELALEGVTRLQLSAQVADGLKGVRNEAEERLVRQVLRETGFNVYQSAQRLGVKRESIYYFLKKFGIERQE